MNTDRTLLTTLTPTGGIFIVDFGWPISANVYFSRGFASRTKKGRIWSETIVDTIWKSLGSDLINWHKPEPLIGGVAVYWEVWKPDDSRVRDVDNFSGKHCLDVLAKANLIGDDCQVEEEHRYNRGKYKKGQVICTVMEI